MWFIEAISHKRDLSETFFPKQTLLQARKQDMPLLQDFQTCEGHLRNGEMFSLSLSPAES